jgi:xylulokinase
MALFIGGDLGTSGLKLLLIDEEGQIVRSVNKSYPLYFPQANWAEQNPADWWEALVKGINELVPPEERKLVRGISLSGQMHGLVTLDKDGNVIRPAILWNDQRAVKEVNYLNTQIGKEKLIRETGNIAYTGFTAPKILWMRKHEPELFARVAHILLPKDYLVYKLTGRFCTDYSDAAGTLLLNVKEKKWSQEMLLTCCLDEEILPSLYESQDKVGRLTGEAIMALEGFGRDVFVLAGAADNAAAALGVGATKDGDCNVCLGTSGTIFLPSDKYIVDPSGTIHAFNSASNNYCLLACMLSAASCLKWLNESIFKTEDYASEQEMIKYENLGMNRVFFLPYLMGERSPINDPEARGLFFGLGLETKREDLTQAVLEGIGFALRDSLEKAKGMGIDIKESYLTGGGSKSILWRQIIADILGLKLKVFKDSHGPSYGMGMLCLVAGGIYKNVEEAKNKLLTVKETIEPDMEKVGLYNLRYRQYKNLYPAVKDLYPKMK